MVLENILEKKLYIVHTGGVGKYSRNILYIEARGGVAPNPKEDVTRSPFTESRLGRTKKQSNARPNVWKILVEDKLK